MSSALSNCILHNHVCKGTSNMNILKIAPFATFSTTMILNFFPLSLSLSLCSSAMSGAREAKLIFNKMISTECLSHGHLWGVYRRGAMMDGCDRAAVSITLSINSYLNTWTTEWSDAIEKWMLTFTASATYWYWKCCFQNTLVKHLLLVFLWACGKEFNGFRPYILAEIKSKGSRSQIRIGSS